MKNQLKWGLITGGVLCLLLLFNNKQLYANFTGEIKCRKAQLKPGNMKVPTARTLYWKQQSAFAESVISNWAKKPLNDKELNGKGNAPRILLAKLMLNKDIAKVNEAILKLIVWGKPGSSWALNKKGDYDFTLTILTTIFWKFADRPDLIYPQTKDHLLNVLLSEEGNKFSYTAPRTLGLAKETENHILMTEGSRYLKNRWLKLHGNNNSHYDNIQNGMEHKLLVFMDEMKTNGLYEFNSLPYIGYTITALLNLEAFASDSVRQIARDVLDYMNWTYALGSYQLKHYPPMRRRYEKAGITELTTNYQSVFMKAWLSFSEVENYNTDISHAEVHALMGVCMPYRPADSVVKTIFNKGDGYFAKLGHGKKACPEIYTAGKHFLLSAGGANRGKRSIIVARPITLFLNNSATNLAQAFHLAGPGDDFMKWNNTGVFQNFACAAGPVVIPLGLQPISANKNWQIYAMNDSISIAVFSSKNLGLLMVFEAVDPASLLEKIITTNPDIELLKKQFQFPNGQKIVYDVKAPKDKWVIVSVNDKVLNRNYDNWPLMDEDNGNYMP